jgi:CBS domain-containing protein
MATLPSPPESAHRPTPRQRPGPFGPARALLPENQQVETVLPTDSTAVAIERLIDSGFGQLPIVDISGHVLGVFTWQSFGRRMSELFSLHIDLGELPVCDTDLEKPRFLDPNTFIDTETDWKEIDYVLVGNVDYLVGVLTISDIYGRLNDFAEAFVLISEIEHEIRDLFRDLYPSDELGQVMQAISGQSGTPEAQAMKALNELLEGDSPMVSGKDATRKIRFAIGQLEKLSRQRERSRTVRSLEDFTFAQYREVIFNDAHWPRFKPVFSQMREMVMADFERINTLRNEVFHFKRKIGPRDTDRLRRFRDRLRYDHGLQAVAQQAGVTDDCILPARIPTPR